MKKIISIIMACICAMSILMFSSCAKRIDAVNFIDVLSNDSGFVYLAETDNLCMKSAVSITNNQGILYLLHDDMTLYYDSLSEFSYRSVSDTVCVLTVDDGYSTLNETLTYIDSGKDYVIFEADSNKGERTYLTFMNEKAMQHFISTGKRPETPEEWKNCMNSSTGKTNNGCETYEDVVKTCCEAIVARDRSHLDSVVYEGFGYSYNEDDVYFAVDAYYNRATIFRYNIAEIESMEITEEYTDRESISELEGYISENLGIDLTLELAYAVTVNDNMDILAVKIDGAWYVGGIKL